MCESCVWCTCSTDCEFLWHARGFLWGFTCFLWRFLLQARRIWASCCASDRSDASNRICSIELVGRQQDRAGEQGSGEGQRWEERRIEGRGQAYRFSGGSGASFWVPMASSAVSGIGFAICSIDLVRGAAESTGEHRGRTWDTGNSP